MESPKKQLMVAPDLSRHDSQADIRLPALYVVLLTLVVGFTEIIGFIDISGIYPGIMTGNTVQLGTSLAEGHWSKAFLVAYAIFSFFLGCMIASAVKHLLTHPLKEYLLMALLLVLASVVREYTLTGATLRIVLELPLLAFAVAVQGETLSKFGGVSVQTIVVTNNMTKFSDALVSRYLLRKQIEKKNGKIPEFKEMLLPGLSWLTYCIAAMAGAWCALNITYPLLIPVTLLIIITMIAMFTSKPVKTT